MTEIKISKIIRSKRRSIGLQICRDAALIVRAPFRVSETDINRLVERKRAWITKHQGIAQNQARTIKPKEFVNGEEFLYLGDSYRLSIVENQATPLLFDKAFLLSQEYLNQAKRIFLDWYKAQARSKITERLNLYLTQAGLKYNRLSITKAQKRWGSCGRNNNLNFSWRLIMAPLRIIDYVVAHEVAHLEHKNHSRRFWNKVAALFPDYKQSRKWLRENDHLLTM